MCNGSLHPQRRPDAERASASSCWISAGSSVSRRLGSPAHREPSATGAPTDREPFVGNTGDAGWLGRATHAATAFLARAQQCQLNIATSEASAVISASAEPRYTSCSSRDRARCAW